MTKRKILGRGIGLFMQEKPKNVVVYLKKETKPVYISIISKEVNATYSHTFNILKKLENLNIVSFKQLGRIKLVKLTELGDEVAKTVIYLLDFLKLAEVQGELDEIYRNEIKGKLREQMNKNSISKHFGKLRVKLEDLSENKPLNIVISAKKVQKKIDEFSTEVYGYPK